MAEHKKTSKDQQRIIGRWTIGATLGKGGYSWVKRGQDIKTGKIVALKFMEKADVSWVKEQAKQVHIGLNIHALSTQSDCTPSVIHHIYTLTICPSTIPSI